jgi:subtilisin family serine protease
MRSVRSRLTVLLAAALTAGALAAAPAHAFLPGFCYVVPAVEVPPALALVGYEPGAASGALDAVARAGGRVVGGIRPLHVVEVLLPSPAALALVRGPGVRFAEAEHAYTATRTPRDPFLGTQWGLTRIGARQAWDRETGRTSAVTVAVIDTGVDLKHPDLVGHVIAGKNVADNTDDPQDDNSHGTHVAGIVAAATDNKVGVAGMSWGAKVLAVKVLNAQGAGSDCDIALGMVSAAQAGARVLNLSLGADGIDCGAVMQEAVDYARNNDALPVVAAGNGAAKGNPSASPANCGGVLAVGATDAWDRVARFSTHQPYVGVSAPGVGILSTYFDPKTNKHEYAKLSGTSMAAPFVAGLAALVRSRHKDWTVDQVITRITSTADDLGARGRDPYYGSGRVNAARALAG